MLTIKHISWYRKGINAVDAAQISAIMVRHAGGHMEGVNATAVTEIVFRGFSAKLIQAKCLGGGLNMKLVRWNRHRRHHGAFT